MATITSCMNAGREKRIGSLTRFSFLSMIHKNDLELSCSGVKLDFVPEKFSLIGHVSRRASTFRLVRFSGTMANVRVIE